MDESQDCNTIDMGRDQVIDLVVDIWRIRHRANRDEATPESVRIACDTALDRLSMLGFSIGEPEGELYDANSRVTVVDQRGGSLKRRICECLSPAVYYDGKLVKLAEVILEGEDDGKANS